MQITRIEVRPRISASDRRLVDAAHQLGFASLTACIVTRLFFVSGTLSDDDAHRLASALLADPVTETYALGVSPTMDDARLVERTLLPGVTDAVADSLKHAAALIGVAVEQAATGERYELTGDLSDSDIGAIARGVLVNTVIHRVSFDTPIGAPFVAVQPTDDTVEIIPVRGLSSDALLNLSKDRRLSLDLNEMRAIQAYFEEIQRDPTDVELEMLAQTWSEHCVHKTFRAKITYTGPAHGAPPNSQPVTQEIDGLLKTYIRAATEQLAKPWVRSAFVDNAGIVAFDDAFDVAFKVETHNRPSALEPFGGANTGAGGVIRDVLGVSARPIANTDVLCFGLPDTPMNALPHNVLHPRRIIAGVIHGIEDYGNKMGIPTVNGAVHYHPGYTANPLVFAGCVGLIPRGSHRTEAQPGDLIVVIGGRTGRDGLRGATFSSMEMDTSTAQLSGGAVQIGNPIVEKQVQEVVLKARDASLYTAITDCGAGGLSSAVGEMGKDLGAHVQLADVPLKYPGLRPWEIWLSEAQERMVLAIPPANWDAFMAICAAHDVEAVAIGIFAPTGQLALFYGDKPVGSVSMAFLHGGIPRRELAAVWTAPSPPGPKTLASASQPAAPNPPLPEGEGLGVRVNPTLLSLLAHPTIRSKAEVVHRYDHEVGGGTAIKPLVGRGAGPGDAAVIVPLESLTPGDEGLPPRAVALSVGLCPQYTALDPYAMAWAAVDEAVRNAVAVGADPDTLAILDNFSWGNTQLPDRLGSLVRCAQGCYDAALAYGTPFISGKDSLNNEYVGLDGERHSIPGTLVISALGIVPDAHKTVTSDFKQAGDPIFLVGETEPDELGGSLYAELTGDSGIVPQPVRDALERYRLLHRAIRAGYVTAAHDCSEGGLSVALAEMCIGGQIGADITLDDEDEDALFCESQGRIIVAVDPAFADDFAALLGEHCARIGTVGGGALVIAGESITVDELAAAWGGVPLAPQPSSALTPAPSPSGRGESRTPDPEYLDIASQAMIYIARDLRQRQTRAEDVLWECLRDRRLGDLKFRRQHPIAHTTVVADFLCYEAQTIIDVDGPIHLDRQEADNDRQRDIEALGYTILRFSNEQIINQTRDTLASIAASCIQARNHTPKPSTNTAPDSPLPEGEGLGVRVSRSGVRVSRSGVRVSRSGVRASRLGVRASRLGVRVSRLGVRVPRLGVRVSRSGVRASRLGVRVSPLGVRVSRSGVRVSRSGVRASRSGVRASRSGGEGLYLRPKPILLLHATGTNRDRDAALACELAGGAPEIVTVNQLVRGERHVRDYAMLVIPGGFSYGDDLGAGVLWALDLRERIPGMEEFVRAGKPVLGICNGFQTLVKSGLLPGHAWDGGTRSVTLTYNAQGRFECRWVTLHANPVSPCLFTEGLDEPIHAPIAHGEGRVMVADEAARERLWADGLPALTYGGGAYPDNPNGSVDAIAGLCSPEGTVFGLMPHPENHVFPWQHPQRINGYSGLRLFENGIRRA